MSLLAGYASKKANFLKTDEILKQMNSFSLISGDCNIAYANKISGTTTGHILQKFRKDDPFQSESIKDGDGNCAAVLGYIKIEGKKATIDQVLKRCNVHIADIENYLEGEFVLIYNRGIDGSLHIVNDRFATRPFFICNSKDAIYFSSTLSFLLHMSDMPPSVDTLGWLQLFSHGRTIGERTTFENIHKLKAATHLVLSEDRVEKKRYWRMRHDPDTELTPENFREDVYQAFRRGTAFRAGLSNNGVVALSGGLDSRLLVGALPETAVCDAFTFVDATDQIQTIEVKAAAEIAGVLDRKHHVKMIPGHFISEKAEDLIKLTGGLTPMHHSAKVLSIIESVGVMGHHYLLGGAPGDVISGDVIPSEKYLNPNRREECLQEFFAYLTLGKHNLRDNLSLVFRQEIIDDLYPELKNSLIRTFDGETNSTAAHDVIAWYVNTGMPTTCFNSPIHAHPVISETFCHIDYEFCDLMSKLPAELLFKRNFYAHMIYHCLPEFNDVVFANTGQPLDGRISNYNTLNTTATKAEYKNSLKELLKRNNRIRKLAASVKRYRSPKVTKPMGKDANIKNEGLFHYFLLQEDETLLSMIIEILHSYAELAHIFNIKKCEKFIKGYSQSRLQTNSYSVDTEMLGSLASLAYSYKYMK